MVDCCKCKCCQKKKLNFKILIPAGTELGTVDFYGVDENDEIVTEYKPGRVRSDWNSDDEEDPDYVPSDESTDIESVYENAHLSQEDIKELEEELKNLLLDQIENVEN
jgi:hypothetical protein